MTVIVTMAGSGKRFRDNGYQVPKHMIRAKGKTLFEWSIESLRNFFDHQFIFACLEEHDVYWIKNKAISLGIKQSEVVTRATLSLGQAHTAYDVLTSASDHDDLWIFNIDTYLEKGVSPSDMLGHQGCAHVFNSTNPGMSFIRYDHDDRVVEFAEKRVISDWATVGLYGFESKKLFREIYENAYDSKNFQRVDELNERYVAPMYQILLQIGGSVCAPRLDTMSVHILGTPQDILEFDPLIKPPFGN